MTKIISDNPSSLISEKRTNNKRLLDFLLSPVVLIRLSSILFFILTIGHTLAYPWTTDQDLREKQLVASMKSVDLVFVGERSSYWSLYFGWGLYVAVLLLTLTIILWFLSNVASLAPRRVGIMIRIISASCLAGAYLSFRFFYIPPFLLLSVIFIILQMAAVRLMRQA
ncbi:LIC_13387 family protein [Mucilaginibacter sp. OK098]|uniref:LIC_13387 family protein n=1 Tax=Mucilaginibacter sp. OK098 TaxID=1855297 RepID=UPI00091D4CA1|nr:hypothetical protein [Mucilaginibacter sp. OK098]SHN23248.1 hypothetical protein SAMN05216524_10718 [Mucilaginibacter sp. OK098]